MLFNAAKLLIISLTTKHFSPFSCKNFSKQNIAAKSGIVGTAPTPNKLLLTDTQDPLPNELHKRPRVGHHIIDSAIVHMAAVSHRA